MSRNDKHIAVKLRKLGKSYKQIASELGMAKGTLSEWFKDLLWSQKITAELTEKNRILSKKRIKHLTRIQKQRWSLWRQELYEQAQKEFPVLKRNKLFLANLMLYWSEGDNKEQSGQVRLGNTDPDMVKLFVRFAKEICLVNPERIKPTLILYPDINEKRCKAFWSKYIGVPESQFYKTQFIQGRHPTKRLENGICTVCIGSTGLKIKILTWIKLYSQELLRV